MTVSHLLRAHVWVLGAVLAAAWSGGVRAEAPASQVAAQPIAGLNWVRLDGASECLSAQELALNVESRAGRSLFVVAGGAKFFVDGYVARGSGGFDVVLELSDAGGAVLGRRSLQIEGEDCRVIDDAVSLIIAITLAPSATSPVGGIALDATTRDRLDTLFGAEPLDPDPQTLPAPSAPRIAVQPAVPPESVDRAPAPSELPSAAAIDSDAFDYALAAAATLGIGQLPAPSIGVAANLAIALGPELMLEAGFAYLPARTARPNSGAGRASFESLVGSFAVCPLHPKLVAGLWFCFGAEAGRLGFEASDFVFDNQSDTDLLLNARASAVWRVRFAGAMFLESSLLVAAPLLQRTYTFRGRDNAPVTLFSMPQASLRADLGLGLAF